MVAKSPKTAIILARGYAALQLLVGALLLYTALTSGQATVQLAQVSGGLPSDDIASVGQRSVLVLGVAFQALIALIVFAAAVTLLFLASGMWRYREWARHATLVLAIVSVPVLCLAPIMNWVLSTASAHSTELVDMFPIPAVILGIILCISTVYIFAYRTEVIALYTPRPNLVRGKGSTYVYAPTPLPILRKK